MSWCTPGVDTGACRRYAPLSLFIRLFFLVFLLAGLEPGAAQAALCGSDQVDEETVVSRVVDGDTLWLDGGLAGVRKLRLIGLNTPEVAKEGQAAQPFGEQASQALKEILPVGTRLAIRYDRDRQDRHKRLLAHAFLANGDSVAARLIARGLAVALVVPPNLWNRACYQEQETLARRRGLGIWSLSDYATPSVVHGGQSLKAGYQLLRGRIQQVHIARQWLWIKLADDVYLRIQQKDWPYFGDHGRLLAWRGKTVEVRGWLIKGKRGDWLMQLRHSDALVALD